MVAPTEFTHTCRHVVLRPVKCRDAVKALPSLHDSAARPEAALLAHK